MANLAWDERNEPSRPGHTCPDIDALIDWLEDLRKANSQLRDYGDYWREKAEEYAVEIDKIVQDKDTEISALEEQVSELKAELEETNNG